MSTRYNPETNRYEQEQSTFLMLLIMAVTLPFIILKAIFGRKG